MTVNTDVRKTGNTVTGRFTLKNLPTFDAPFTSETAKKPLFAYVGVADLAIERAKDLPAELTTATTAVTKKAQSLLAEVPGQVTALPTTVRTSVEKATGRATEVYTKLSVRGERLVTQIRRQPATAATLAEGKEAVKKANEAGTAAANTARKSVKAGEDAAHKIG